MKSEEILTSTEFLIVWTFREPINQKSLSFFLTLRSSLVEDWQNL